MLNLDKSNWETVRLGDVVSQSKEKVDPTDGSVDRYIAGEHLDTDDLTIHRWGNVDDGYLGPAFHRRFRPGQVLYGSRRTYLRKVAVADFDGVCANTTFVLDAKPDRLSPRLLPFVMSSEPFHAFAIAESRGSVNPYVNWSDIARYEFALPPLDEQERIADLLWAGAEALGDVRRAAEWTNRTQGLYLSQLLDGVPLQRVGDVIGEPVRNGVSLPANTEGLGSPTLSIAAIRDGRVRPQGAVKFVSVERSRVAPFLIESNDFFVVRGNGNRRMVALGGLVTGDEGLPNGAFYPDLMMRVRFDPERVLPAFGAMAWNAPSVHSVLVAKAKSTNGTWKVNGKDVTNHHLPVPSLDRQREILMRCEVFQRAHVYLLRQAENTSAICRSVSNEVWSR